MLLGSSWSSLQCKLWLIRSSVAITKTPTQIQTQIEDDVLGFHVGRASLLHQVPSLNLGCRPLQLQGGCPGSALRLWLVLLAFLLLLLAQSVSQSQALPKTHNPLLSVAGGTGKPGRGGIWKPPRNKDNWVD